MSLAVEVKGRLLILIGVLTGFIWALRRLCVLWLVLIPGAGLLRAQNPARQAGYLYLSPVPGALYVSPRTRFVLARFADVTPSEVTNLATGCITVDGSESGFHSGVTYVASDGRTVIYRMTKDFNEGELVTVKLEPQLDPGFGEKLRSYEYQFTITPPTPESRTVMAAASSPPPAMGPPNSGDPGGGANKDPAPTNHVTVEAHGLARIMPNGVSVPGDFPEIQVTLTNNPSPGYIFLNNPGTGEFSYSMMLNNDGAPVWYRRSSYWQFQVQADGTINWKDPSTAYDQNFDFVKTYHRANGYNADGHEVKVLSDGTYFLLGYLYNTVDMTQYLPDANPSASVLGTVLQEFTPSNEMIFQWRGWDHYDVRDQLWEDPLEATFSFPHLNAIDVDEDGNLVVSARGVSEVTKINRDTGEVMWRLGSARSDFTFVNDPLNGISCQHNITALGDNHYLLFDNGNFHQPAVSRVVEYELDLTHRTATLVWEFRDTPDRHTSLMGNAQRLPSGNTLINFVLGTYPTVMEVDTNGTKQFELNVLPPANHYRVYRFPWNGIQTTPYLIVEAGEDDVALVFNKFGDHSVDHFNIYGGTSPHPTTLLATSVATLKHVTNVVNGVRNYFRVTAVNTNGVECPYSNEESLDVYFVKPGQQMVLNGDFSQGTNDWTCAVTGGASAQWQIKNEASFIEIANGGNATASIKLWQAGKPLIQGKCYVFEFDAWSQQPRYVQAHVARVASPYLDYSGGGISYLTPVRNHYRRVFTMQQTSDFNAGVVFELGGSPLDVSIDNVSLLALPTGDFNVDGQVDLRDLAVMAGEWLEQQSNLDADLNGDGRVDFNDFALFGKNWNGSTR